MRAAGALASIAALALQALAASSAEITLVDVTEAAGIDFRHLTGAAGGKHPPETMGSGAVLFDYDGDLDADIYLVQSGALPGEPPSGPPATGRLYRNLGGWRFHDVTAEAGLADAGYGMGAAAGDYDGDGDPDLYVTRLGPNRLYRNEGDGTFSDVTGAAGVGDASWSAGAAWADLDGDGELDLYVANYLDWSRDDDPRCWHRGGERPQLSYCLPDAFRGQPDRLYRNRGDGTFESAGASAGIAVPWGKGLGVATLDEDGDGRPDLYVANDTMPNALFRNLGGLRFDEVAIAAGVAYDADGAALAGMGVDVADVDLDGDLDLFVTNFQGESNTLYRRDHDGFFSDVSRESGLGLASRQRLGFGAAFADLDDDGLPDLVVANGHLDDLDDDGADYAQPNQVFANRGAGRFEEVPALSGAPAVSRGLAVADLDGDGDLDLIFTSSGGRPELLRNETRGGDALRLLLVGRRGNRDAIGARVRVKLGDARPLFELRAGSSYLSQHERIVHVGLGRRDGADDVSVEWPGGGVEDLGPRAGGQLVVVVEGRGVVASYPFRPRRIGQR